jgi:signal transduction histidine kinase
VLAEQVSWVALAGTFVPEVPAALTRALHDVAGVAAAAVLVVLIVGRAVLVRRLNGVVSALAPDIEGGVAALLASALRDPEVRLGHLVQDVGFVDLAGQELGPVEPGRRHTELADGAAVVAVIDHRRDVPPGLLAGRLGPTLRTAIQNEGLEVRLRREVAELAQSRRRIVEHADAERSRLERDLHDGAQHRLLALAIELSRLRRQLSRTTPGEPHPLKGAVDRAASASDELLRRLREVARGIHPAVLDGGGLVPALHQLADSSPAQFLLSVGDVGELPAAAARTAYALARDATSGPVEEMALRYEPDGRCLVLAVESPAPAPQPVHDRAAAANASIIATPTGWEVRLPCLSSSLTTPS